MITPIQKIEALLVAITRAEIDALPAAKRQRFAQLCRHLADLAEAKAPPPKAGVLSDLRNGNRAP